MSARLAWLVAGPLLLAAATHYSGVAAASNRVPALRATRAGQRTTWDSVYSPAQAERGEAFYGSACARCHQATLGGADQSPALAGPAFLEKWDGLSLSLLHDRIRLTMPSGNPGIHTRQEVTDVIAYLLNYNAFPVGKKELPTDRESLDAIRIAVTRPGDQ
jgi:mono/diheme cytochrome c family protein